jgi:hypothetical protein
MSYCRIPARTDLGLRLTYVRSSLISDRIADIAGGPFGAITGNRGLIRSPRQQEAISTLASSRRLFARS